MGNIADWTNSLKSKYLGIIRAGLIWYRLDVLWSPMKHPQSILLSILLADVSSYCGWPLFFVVNWKHFCPSLPTDTGEQTDDCFVMRPRSSIGGAIQMTQLQLQSGGRFPTFYVIRMSTIAVGPPTSDCYWYLRTPIPNISALAHPINTTVSCLMSFVQPWLYCCNTDHNHISSTMALAIRLWQLPLRWVDSSYWLDRREISRVTPT